MLVQRLRELEAAGVVRRRTLPPPAASQVYELTEWGAGLDAVVVELGRWGALAEPSDDPRECRLGHDQAAHALRPAAASGAWTATYEVRLGRYRFTTRVTDGQLVAMSRGEAP